MSRKSDRSSVSRLAFGLIAGSTLSLTASPAIAQVTTDPVDQILACRQITDAQARLDCFDAASGSLQTARDTGEIAVVMREDVQAVERDTFGLDLPSMPRLSLSMFSGRNRSAPNPLDPATSSETVRTGETAVASTDQAPQAPATPRETAPDESNGVQVVERDDDGGVERVVMVIDRIEAYTYNKHLFYMENGQVWRQLDTLRVRLSRNQTNEAEIRRAAMGSYLLRINGRGQAIRVIRDR